MNIDVTKKNSKYEIPDAINPRKSWRILLYVCLIISIVGFVFDYYLYTFVSREPLYVEVPGEEMKIERLKVEKIKNIIAFFDSKIEKSLKLKVGNLIDPSL